MSRAIFVVFFVIPAFFASADPGISTEFESLLRNRVESPFTDRLERLRIAVELREVVGPALSRALGQHIAHEKKLADQFQALRDKALDAGLDPKAMAESFFVEMNRRMSLQSPELRDFVRLANSQSEAFIHSMNIHIQNAVDLSLAISLHAFRLWVVDHWDEIQLETTRVRVASTYKKLEMELERYLKNKHQFGQNKDTYRVSAYKSYFGTLRRLARDFDESVKNTPSAEPLKRTWRQNLSVLRAGLSTLGEIVWPASENESRREFSSRIFELVRRLGVGTAVQVERPELNPSQTQSESQKVLVFVASHRDGYADILGVANLHRHDLVVFGAPNNFLQKMPAWARRFVIWSLNRSDGFVVVGEGRKEDSIDKAVRLAKETGARAFLIFPEGRLPEGMGGSMDVRKGFNAEGGLIAELEKDGQFEVEIIPLSMRYNARLFNTAPLTSLNSQTSGRPSLAVRLSGAIDQKSRKLLDEAAGPEALGNLLRMGHMEDLITDENLFIGQLRADRMVPVLAQLVGGPSVDCVSTLLKQD